MDYGCIVDWTRYQKAFVDCKNVGLKNYLEKIYSDKTGIEDLIKQKRQDGNPA